MKRIDALQALSNDHLASLALAERCKTLAQSADQEAIGTLARQLVSEFDKKWDVHFRMEEQALFQVARDKGGEIATICAHLEKEHDIMRGIAKQMAEGDYSALNSFGEILYDHTQVEERLLFPLVKQQFTPHELTQVQTLSEA